MFRINRSRFIGIACLVIFVYFLVFTDSGSSSSNFRANTEAGLASRKQREQDLPLRGRLSDEDLTKKTNDELQGILNSQSKEKLAKDEDGNSLGRQHRESPRQKPVYGDSVKNEAAKEDPLGRTRNQVDQVEDDEDDDNARKTLHETGSSSREKPLVVVDQDGQNSDKEVDVVQEKLDAYLKSPVVIFSKSYCPHSKRAKHLLLNVYKIDPKPLVVELDLLTEKVDVVAHEPSTEVSEHDEHTKTNLGKVLQNLLAKTTGRRTVPNIVIGGQHSIGGNDKIWEMHESGTLADEIQKFGGRKIVSVDVSDIDHDRAA